MMPDRALQVHSVRLARKVVIFSVAVEIRLT